MSKKVAYLLGILLTILIGTFLYWKFCCGCCKNPNSGQEVAVEANGSGEYRNFNLNGDGLKYESYDNFRFTKNEFGHLLPISDSINFGIDQLGEFLTKGKNQKCTITGYCTSAETNTSAFPNLGFARANDVKNYLISKGIASDRLEIDGQIKDAWAMNVDTVLGPIDFALSEIMQAKPGEKSGEDWDALKEKINANPLILYFNTNQSDVNLTAEERQKVADMVKYLDHVSTANISAVGHTDNTGDRANNIKLGQGRADFAKQYLVKNGIPDAKIISSSKGPDVPIADNATEEGKAKNRRTVVSIQ
ncbi:MAG: OmpA family protein [Bacteroidetes bacterium]|jgi:OOP family OmpA-OmpF porin|nr:OmpA family protein [Bacteroidota bacterium]MBK7638893.1 OmpA family protein [Bacteroidota bacterium]MBK9353359.1 OmpA family protein [Bacteroidota bacterium]MBL0287290.1 OmpA family protein [Bacteroidota bacterium]